MGTLLTKCKSARPQAQRGATLIELMIALVLGLLVVAAASGLFLSNKRLYGSTETVNRIQENTRVAFEIMSRDIREAGATPCGSSSKIVNQLTTRGSPWWQDYFARGLRGYGSDAAPGTATGSGVAQRVAGTDAIDLYSANDGDYAVVEHKNPSATLDLNHNGDLAAGDIAMVCNQEYSLIFQITGLNAKGVLHNGGSGTPGNCGSEFQFEEIPAGGKCAGASAPNGYCMMGSTSAQCVLASAEPASLSRIDAYRWYVGNNSRGGTSLYRARMQNRTGTATPDVIDPVEIAEGVTGLDLQYRSLGSTAWQGASAVADWSRVNAVRVSLTVGGAEGAVRGADLRGTDGTVLSRKLTHVVAIRNREGVL